VNTLRGIALDAWVTIDGDCPMTSEVSKSEVQLELGHGIGSLHLVLGEDGLTRLLEIANEALAEMRTEGVQTTPRSIS
jgi:hypothetical protein